jgi:dephospho-CoA kinase
MSYELPNFAFVGRAGSGKTTCAEILVKQFGYIRLSFAEPLKLMCGTATDREQLQRVGVGVRELVPDGWVNLLLHDLNRREANAHRAGRYVIDDCRFPNEAQALLAHGFRFVRVGAPTSMRVDRLIRNGKLTDEAQLEHESETALDGFMAHHAILNSGFPTSLERQIVEILNKERW